MRLFKRKIYMELENYEISCSIDFENDQGKEKTIDVTFPIEVSKYKEKMKKVGFNSENEILCSSCNFNMFVGYNHDELPEDKTLTEYNLIALVFEDINKMKRKQRIRYEQNSGIYNSFMHSAANELETNEDVEYFHNVLDTNEFPYQSLRYTIKYDFQEKYYLAGVVRRSLESGKDYFSEDFSCY